MRVETKRTLKRFFKNPSAIIGLSILVFFTFVAVFAPLIAPPLNPRNPERRLANPYILPKITWKIDPQPPLSKSEAEKNLMIKGFEKILRKMDAERIAPLVSEIAVHVDHKNLCRAFYVSRTLRSEIKEELKKYVKLLSEHGISKPESLINSYSRNSFIMVCDKAVDVSGDFRKFLKGLVEDLSGLSKGELIGIFKTVAEVASAKVVNTAVKKLLGIEGDPFDWMLEQGLVKRRPIRTIDYHPFGMIDGRDIMYGVVWGTRTAFRIGIVVTVFATLIGLVIGSISGYYGGWVDEVLMRITDVFLSIPFLVAAIVFTTFLGTGLDKVMIAMIFFGWMGTARLIRGNILQVKEEQFILAAKALGVKDFFIIMKHVLPNTIFPVVIQASMRMGSLVITAAALSFLGLGAPTGYADWGSLLNYSRDWILGAQGEAFKYWFALFYPGTAMVLFVLAWNLLGDALRDTFDPRLRG